MYARIMLLLLSLWPVVLAAQSVVIKIEYQPNTIYQWTRSSTHDMTVEYLGAEDMGDIFSQIGIEPYSERRDDDYIKVRMKTDDWVNQKLTYSASIDSLKDDFISSNPRSQLHSRDQLDIHDLQIYGVVNRFQKIEVDSIHGVDSLYEKNKVFKLLDDIHRSLTYPKDTLLVGQKVEQASPFVLDFFYTSAELNTNYLLEKIVDGIAYIKLEYAITVENNDEFNELPKMKVSVGSGIGLLLYAIDLKQVIFNEHKMSIKSFKETAEMAIESTTASTYRWTMNIIE